MNFITLNINGVTGAEKPVWIRKLKRETKFSFLGLQETHQAGLSECDIRRFWDRSPVEFASVDAAGRSGGLASCWDPGIFSVDSVIKSQRFLVVSGSAKGLAQKINILNTHAPNDLPGRRTLWDSIVDIKMQLAGFWVILGDFNDVRQPHERVNSRYDPTSSAEFNDFISRAGLLEYNMSGGKFTYISDNSDIKFSKLDRILVCDLFMQQWPLAELKVLRKGWSDHCPR
ncbi:putative Endonuclease/exonuclease/phosphatase superfamily [Helianthus anomalus]